MKTPTQNHRNETTEMTENTRVNSYEKYLAIYSYFS